MWLSGKELACQCRRHKRFDLLGSIPGSGRCPGVGNSNPLQYSCLENPMDRGARWATVHGVTKSWTRLSTHTHPKVDESESESRSVIQSWRPHGLYRPWNLPGLNSGVGSLSLLQGIFPTQESNQGLLHFRWILSQMRYQVDTGSLI